MEMSGKCNSHMNFTAQSANLVNSSMTKGESVKSLVCIQTGEGYVQEVELKVAILCGAIRKEIRSGRGCCVKNPVSLHPVIKKNIFNFVLNFCRYHDIYGSVYKGHDLDEILIEMDPNNLCELIYVAHYLKMELLSDLTFKAMNKKMRSFSCFEDLCGMLKCPDNIPEEEHLQWINLLRRNFTHRKKGTKENENSKKCEIISKPRQGEDTRSVDDLLAFINGGDGDSKGVKAGKKKKKNNKKGRENNDSSLCATSSSKKGYILKKGVEGPDEISTQDSNSFEDIGHGIQSISISTVVSDDSKLENTCDNSFTVEDDIDDEDFDRVLEEFVRRLTFKGPITPQELRSRDFQSKSPYERFRASLQVYPSWQK